LVFGLPLQELTDMKESIEKTIRLKPDTISLYSYAHVPWVKGTGQRGFSDKDLPSGDEKRALYEYAKQALLSVDYIEIGMDHFGLPTEPLTQAMLKGELNRTFMGYTTSATKRSIGLGASAISEYDFGYAQNVKSIKEYHEKINDNELPVFKGHIHTYLDKSLKKHILSLMCNFETKYCPNSYIEQNLDIFATAFKEFEKDGILKWDNGHLRITKDGRPFVRNVCMSFDPYAAQKTNKPRFSKSV
jgi:oxygen-independent coproporphyrinogen-3 oxidase